MPTVEVIPAAARPHILAFVAPWRDAVADVVAARPDLRRPVARVLEAAEDVARAYRVDEFDGAVDRLRVRTAELRVLVEGPADLLGRIVAAARRATEDEQVHGWLGKLAPAA